MWRVDCWCRPEMEQFMWTKYIMCEGETSQVGQSDSTEAEINIRQKHLTGAASRFYKNQWL